MRSRSGSLGSLFSEDEVVSGGLAGDAHLQDVSDSAMPSSSRALLEPPASPLKPWYGDLVASRTTPPIPGLWAFPDLLPPEIAHSTVEAIARADLFSGGRRDQVMVFSRPSSGGDPVGMPTFMTDLISAARRLLASQLPFDVVNTLFEQTLPRQIILNLYPSGQGISPHVDLPARYADGIVGVSLMGGCVMSFTRDQGVEEERHDLYLPPRTIYVLTGPARWDWAHGISSKTEDLVQGESGVQTILRDLRVSATFRWMKEGADILW